MRRRDLLQGFAVVALFCVIRIYSTTTTAIGQKTPHDAVHEILDKPGSGIDDTLVLKHDIVYSAKACSLVPAWGGMNSSGPTSGCVGRGLEFPNTTATYLTCDDEKPALTERNHPGVTIALLYFAKPALLFRQLQVFATYPETVQLGLTILIIDDGSPAGLRASEYLNMTSYDSLFRIRMARITTEKHWNIGGARNLAFYLVDTPKTLLLDLDVIVPWPAMEAAMSWPLVNPENGRQLAHRFNRRRPDGSENKHPAVCMIRTAAYWENGGCDEDFCGSYGFTDVHFWFRWKADPTKVLVDHLEVFIEEFEMPACDRTLLGDAKAAECHSARSKQVKPSRNLNKNRVLYKEKTKKGCWSNKYLKFRWVLEG